MAKRRTVEQRLASVKAQTAVLEHALKHKRSGEVLQELKTTVRKINRKGV
jgi:hypothetical protein